MGRKPGLPVLFTNAGSDILWYRFTVDGTRHRESTGCRDHGAAAEVARAAYAEALAGRPPSRDRRASSTSPLALLFAEFVLSAKASGRADSYTVKLESHFRAHFRRRWATLRDITTAAIERYKVERAAKVSSTTVYKELVSLSRFLHWCKRAGHLHELPEFERLRPVSTYRPPDLTPEQVHELLAVIPDHRTHHNRLPVREFYTVQWAQALRPGELRTLTWQDVDLRGKRMTIRLANDKARAGRTIGLARESYAVLEELSKRPHLPTGRVFGRSEYRESLRIAAKKLGLPRLSPHHLRHARLTEIAGTTRDVGALQYFAGHKQLATTDRYVRSRTERTEEMLRGLTEKRPILTRNSDKMPKRRGASKK